MFVAPGSKLCKVNCSSGKRIITVITFVYIVPFMHNMQFKELYTGARPILDFFGQILIFSYQILIYFNII